MDPKPSDRTTDNTTGHKGKNIRQSPLLQQDQRIIEAPPRTIRLPRQRKSFQHVTRHTSAQGIVVLPGWFSNGVQGWHRAPGNAECGPTKTGFNFKGDVVTVVIDGALKD